MCGGSGLVQSKTTTLNQLERGIRRFKAETHEKRLIVRVHPELGSLLHSGAVSRARRIMLKYFLWLKIESDPDIPVTEFRCISPKRGLRDVTDKYR